MGAILAGGRSRRMNGRNKALLPLGGKPMLQHVIDRVRPQVCELFLSVEQRDPAYEPFGLHQLEDPAPGSNGPLGGVLSALQCTRNDAPWLLLVPCDAPFLPMSLSRKLMGGAIAENARLVTIACEDEWQPTFSLWHRDLLDSLGSAVLERGFGSLKHFMREHGAHIVEWPSPFMNINDLSSMRRAERWIAEENQPC